MDETKLTDDALIELLVDLGHDVRMRIIEDAAQTSSSG
jgi:hypothetical protein